VPDYKYYQKCCLLDIESGPLSRLQNLYAFYHEARQIVLLTYRQFYV
jgi:hypothetical protein